MAFSNLAKRLLFAAWAVPLGWWVVNSTISVLPEPFPYIYPGQVLIVILIFMACFEYVRMLKIFYEKNAFWVSYIWLGLQVFFYIDNTNLPSSLSFYLLLILVALEAFILGKAQSTETVG